MKCIRVSSDVEDLQYKLLLLLMMMMMMMMMTV